MATHIASFGELTAMPLDELRKEITDQRTLVSKMRLGIQLSKEKDTAKFRRERRALARMHAALHTLTTGSSSAKLLKKKPKNRSISAPSVS